MSETESIPLRLGWYVYRLLNHDHDMFYVGMTNNLYARLGTHSKRWGDQIKTILIFQCDSAENALQCEKIWIQKYRPYYNTVHNKSYAQVTRQSKWRNRFGITPFELAKATGFSPQRALAYLSGDPVPPDMKDAFDAVFRVRETDAATTHDPIPGIPGQIAETLTAIARCHDPATTQRLERQLASLRRSLPKNQSNQ